MEAIPFGKYQLQERLAEGGMAVVWRAKLHGPEGFEKVLCLKQIRQELAQKREFVDLFIAEAKLTVALTHANIVPVYELGKVDDTFYLALELIDGPPVARLIDDKQGPISPPLAAYIVEQVLRGLDYAHRRGVVHRDLSAANVLASRDGEVKIVDFGIAAAVDARGIAGGSRGYIAPEQEAGGRTDARSDLYGVGVLLWELLMGARYDAETELRAPTPLGEIVQKAMAPDPGDRYEDAAAMLVPLGRYLRDVESPTQADLSKFVRRRCPDVPVQSSREGGSVGLPPGADGPQTTPGPRTRPIERSRQVTYATGRQVTFATGKHFAIPETQSPKRIVWWLLGLLVASGASAAILLLEPTPPLPLPPEPRVVEPVKTAPVPDLLAPAASASLGVFSKPEQAEVRVNGKIVGKTPLRTTPIESTSEVNVEVSLRGFASFKKTLRTGDFAGVPPQARLETMLEPLPKGFLTLGAVPWAHVSVDGEARPDTPLQRLALPAGAHQVRLNCPATGRELRFSVTVTAGKEIKRVADLRGEPKLID